MRKTSFLCVVCFVLVSCSYDFVDLLSTYHISGMAIENENNVINDVERIVTISIHDINLDETRQGAQRLIAMHEISLGLEFEFVEQYFWGMMVSDPSETIGPEDPQIAVDIKIDGCGLSRTIIHLSEMPRENGTTMIDLGVLRVDC